MLTRSRPSTRRPQPSTAPQVLRRDAGAGHAEQPSASDTHKTAGEAESTPRGPASAALLPIMAVVGIAFLTIGFVLPVLPLHVHLGLGLSTFIVGVVTGS